MKMIFFVFFMMSHLAMAQVNLDRAYLGATGNTLFHDLNDANAIWVIPKYLEATSSDEVIKVGSAWHVRYTVGLPQKTLTDLVVPENSPLVFRAFRATEVKLEQMTDIDPKLKPQIIPLGDIGMFGEKIPYSLSLQAKHYPNTAQYTARHLFNGQRSYLLGRIFYYFSAVRSGQLFQAQSVVAILAPRTQVPKPTAPKKKKSTTLARGADLTVPLTEYEQSEAMTLMMSSVESINKALMQYQSENTDSSSLEKYNPRILFHSQSQCWDQGLENVICLKDI